MGKDLNSLVPITMDDIVPNVNLPGDVFFKLSEDNFVVIGREGTREQFKELHFFDKIKNANIYIKKPDLRKFSALKVLSASEIMKSDKASVETKVTTLSQTLNTVFTCIDQLGFNNEALGNSKFIANSVLKIINDTPKLTTLMSIMNSISEDLVRHSMAVSMVSALISQSKGWNNHSILEKMALGAILHDIGLKEYPKEFLAKPRVEYTAEDLEYYQKHAFRGVEILRTVENVPQEVMAIVYEHHENSIGQGYPRALRDVRLHPFSKVVALADTFCELAFKDTQNPTVRSPDEALNFIEHTLGQPFNKECFAALKNVLMFGIRKASIKIV
jgi:putative nucleotidyltransferase with HDIG domain